MIAARCVGSNDDSLRNRSSTLSKSAALTAGGGAVADVVAAVAAVAAVPDGVTADDFGCGDAALTDSLVGPAVSCLVSFGPSQFRFHVALRTFAYCRVAHTIRTGDRSVRIESIQFWLTLLNS